MTRRRADVVLAERGLFDSRERAKAAILAGEVRIDGQIVSKAGEQIDPDSQFDIAPSPDYVSRGGKKLAGALDEFGFNPTGLRAADIGASTGGFTDCLLQRGVASVAAVDVGYGQFAWKLRNDDRVTVFERTNVRHADPSALGAPFDLLVVDVSFISLRKILPNLLALTGEQTDMFTLVKPQFEAGKGRVGKKGVVRDPDIHREVLEDVSAGIIESGLAIGGISWSPIKGPEGNIEFWIWSGKGIEAMMDVDIAALVDAAHQALGV